MKTQTFKTTINCGGCVRAVTPVLNAEPAIASWQVDTTTPHKILTVKGDLAPEYVTELLANVGFQAELVPA